MAVTPQLAAAAMLGSLEHPCCAAASHAAGHAARGSTAFACCGRGSHPAPRTWMTPAFTKGELKRRHHWPPSVTRYACCAPTASSDDWSGPAQGLSDRSPAGSGGGKGAGRWELTHRGKTCLFAQTLCISCTLGKRTQQKHGSRPSSAGSAKAAAHAPHWARHPHPGSSHCLPARQCRA